MLVANEILSKEASKAIEHFGVIGAGWSVLLRSFWRLGRRSRCGLGCGLNGWVRVGTGLIFEAREFLLEVLKTVVKHIQLFSKIEFNNV